MVDSVEMALVTTVYEETFLNGNRVGKNETYRAQAERLSSTFRPGKVGASASLLRTACGAVDEDLASACLRLAHSRQVVEAKDAFRQAVSQKGGTGQYYGKSSVAM